MRTHREVYGASPLPPSESVLSGEAYVTPEDTAFFQNGLLGSAKHILTGQIPIHRPVDNISKIGGL